MTAAMRAERRAPVERRRAVYLSRSDLTRLRRVLEAHASCITPGCRCTLRERDDELERRLEVAAAALEGGR